MKLFRIIYISIGVLLASAVFIYALTGLSQKDRDLYADAISLGENVGRTVWPGLRIGEYPVAIRKGSAEYVLKDKRISRRNPVLPVIACTAYKVNGEVNVFLPCKSEMESVGQIAEGLSTDMQHFLLNRFSMNRDTLTDSHYISILYHESLHAYQIKYFEGKLMEMQFDGEESDIGKLIAGIEQDPVISSLYDRQFRIMSRLAKEMPKEPSLAEPLLSESERSGLKELFLIRDAIGKAVEEMTGPQNSIRIKKYIDFTELVEGTARYVELKTTVALKDNTLQQQYLSSLQETAKGKEKYYRSGMTLWLLLDKTDPGWKESVFAGGLTLADLLENAVEEQ